MWSVSVECECAMVQCECGVCMWYTYVDNEATDRIGGHDLHIGVRRLQHDVQHVKIAVGNQLQSLWVTLREKHLCDLECHTRVPGAQGR